MRNKKILKYVILLSVISILSIVLRTRIISYKSKEINYAVEYNLTHGMFNRYKLYSVHNLEMSYSDGNIAVVRVEGIEKNKSHRKALYNVFLERTSRGVWKIKKLYPIIE
ncbi:hypothetical protein [Clostridium peptidivorans]|uniref:hypothetical protein n=1 Tax=Clostridium peptidivorans TaxID=100174 RepID=UPI000BE26253|nr:hypothetical protein [Clostridium peptidivorans]